MIGRRGHRSTSVPAKSPTRTAGPSSAAASRPISNGPAPRTRIAVKLSAVWVKKEPKVETVVALQRRRKSGCSQRPVRGTERVTSGRCARAIPTGRIERRCHGRVTTLLARRPVCRGRGAVAFHPNAVGSGGRNGRRYVCRRRPKRAEMARKTDFGLRPERDHPPGFEGVAPREASGAKTPIPRCEEPNPWLADPTGVEPFREHR